MGGSRSALGCNCELILSRGNYSVLTGKSRDLVSIAHILEVSREWVPGLVLLGILILSYRDLIGFESISPLNENREGVVDGQLFVPNQKSIGLIFGLSTFFLLSRYARLRSHIGERPAYFVGGLFLFLGLVIQIWSHYTGESALLIVSLSLVLLGSAAVLGGLPALREIRLPAIFLLLALPIPAVLLNSFIYRLQLLTAALNGALLSFVGIENVVSGDVIYTSFAAFHVIEGCSGLRTMETMLMTAVVYQELVPYSRLYSWILVVTAPILGVIVNQMRVLAIVLNPMAEESSDHTLQGIVMIVVGTLMLAGFALLLSRWLPGPDQGQEAGGMKIGSKPDWPLARVTIVSSVLLIGVVASLGSRWEIERTEHRNPVRLPSSFDGWVAEPNRIYQEFLGSTRYTQAISRVYRRGGDEVSILLAVDTRVRSLVSGISPKNASLGQGWQVVSELSLPIVDLSGVQATVSVQRNLDRYAYVVSWRQGVAGFGTEVVRDAFAMDRSPWQRPYDATLVRISTPIRRNLPGQEGMAYERLEPFIRLVQQNFPLPEDSSTN